mgnify:CR=1 FL=1
MSEITGILPPACPSAGGKRDRRRGRGLAACGGDGGDALGCADGPAASADGSGAGGGGGGSGDGSGRGVGRSVSGGGDGDAFGCAAGPAAGTQGTGASGDGGGVGARCFIGTRKDHRKGRYSVLLFPCRRWVVVFQVSSKGLVHIVSVELQSRTQIP